MVVNRLTWNDLGARPAFFPALCLATGACLLGRTTGAFAGAFLILAACLCGCAIGLRGRSGAHLLALLACLLAGGGLAGLSFADAAVEPLSERPIEAVVDEARRTRDGEGQTLVVSLLPPLSGRAVLYGRTAGPELLQGQRIRTFARLSPLEGPDNPGEADFASRRWREGIAYRGSFDPRRTAALSPPSPSALWLAREHAALSAKTRQLSTSPAAAALFLTLAAGERAQLSAQTEDDFARSGLAHILSVSGLHVAMLALMLLGSARFTLVFVVRRPGIDARRLAAPLAIPFVWAYVAYTGWQPPAVRSALMATVALTGLCVWRRGDGLNALSLALLVLVAVWPAAVADLSSQLSFLAVFSLVLLTPALRAAVPVDPPPRSGKRGVRDWLRRGSEVALRTGCASAAVTLASLPLVLSAFGRASVAGLVSNIVALPLAGVLTALAAGGAAVFTASPVLSTPLLWLGTLSCEVLLAIAQLFAQLPFATVELPPPNGWLSAAWLVGLGFFALARGRARWVAVTAPVALVAMISLPDAGRSGMEVSFLAVGQGDSIVVSSAGKHALIDGGGVPKGGDVGARVVVPFLRHKGITALQLAVLSHPHPDHALGLISALEHVTAEQVWIPRGARRGPLIDGLSAAKGAKSLVEVDARSPAVQLGEARVEVLGPPDDDVLLEGVNDRSVVLRIVHGDVVILLTGDIEAAAEEQIIRDLPATPVTVLKVPHHGSRTSSTPAFLSKVRPRIAVFCVGRRNRFGFPHPEVQDSYSAVGAECYRTDVDGAVTVYSDGRDVRVATWHPRGVTSGSSAQVAAAEDHPQPTGR